MENNKKVEKLQAEIRFESLSGAFGLLCLLLFVSFIVISFQDFLNRDKILSPLEQSLDRKAGEREKLATQLNALKSSIATMAPGTPRQDQEELVIKLENKNRALVQESGVLVTISRTIPRSFLEWFSHVWHLLLGFLISGVHVIVSFVHMRELRQEVTNLRQEKSRLTQQIDRLRVAITQLQARTASSGASNDDITTEIEARDTTPDSEGERES